MERQRVRRVTQADIAKHAGVSTAVVSLVLNNSANGRVKIAEKTQQRVREAMHELGYVPNTAARHLARGRTNVIGVFTYEAIFPLESNSFYHRFLVGIEAAASRLGFNLLLLTGSLDNGRRTIFQNGANLMLAAEGALILGANEDRDEVRQLWNEGYPFVFVGRREIDGENIPCSAADYAGASEELVSKFIEVGHRRIVIVSEHDATESQHDRKKGVAKVAATHPDVQITSVMVAPDELTPQWLQNIVDSGATAVISTSMPYATSIWELADSLNISIPDQLSLGALGNSSELSLDSHGITTFSIPQIEMGSSALNLLASMLAHDPLPPYPITIPCSFVPGSTLARPSSAASRMKGDSDSTCLEVNNL